MSTISHVDPSSSLRGESSTSPESETVISASNVDDLVQSLRQEALALADQWDQKLAKEHGSLKGIGLNAHQGLGRDIRVKIMIDRCVDDLSGAADLALEAYNCKIPISLFIKFAQEYLLEGLRRGKPISIDSIFSCIHEVAKLQEFKQKLSLLPFLPSLPTSTEERQQFLLNLPEYIRSISTDMDIFQKTLQDFTRKTALPPEILSGYLFYFSEDFIIELIGRTKEERDFETLKCIFEFLVSLPLIVAIFDKFRTHGFENRRHDPNYKILSHTLNAYRLTAFVDQFLQKCFKLFPVELFSGLSDSFKAPFDSQHIHRNALEKLRAKDPKLVESLEGNLENVPEWPPLRHPYNAHIFSNLARLASELPTVRWGVSLESFIESFVEDNIEIAVCLVGTLEAVWIDVQYLVWSAYAEKLASVDPEKAIGIIKKIKDEYKQLESLIVVGEATAKQNPKKGIEVLKYIQETFPASNFASLRLQAFNAITRQIAEKDATLVLQPEYIQLIREDTTRLLLFIPHLAKSDPHKALHLLQEVTTINSETSYSFHERDALTAIAAALGLIDLTKAMRLISTLDPGHEYDKAFSAVVPQILEINPLAVLAYERGLKDSSQRDAFIFQAIEIGGECFADKHFDIATDLISDISDVTQRRGPLFHLAKAIGAKNPTRAYELLRMTANTEGKHSDHCGEVIAKLIVETAPEKAFDILEHCELGSDFISSRKIALLERIGELLTPDDITQVPDLIKKYKNYGLNYHFYRSLLVNLTKIHGKLAIQFLDLLDYRESRQIAEEMIKHIARKDLAAAQALAESLDDRDCQESALLRIAKVKVQTDFSGAVGMVRKFSSLYLRGKGLAVLSRQVRLIQKRP